MPMGLRRPCIKLSASWARGAGRHRRRCWSRCLRCRAHGPRARWNLLFAAARLPGTIGAGDRVRRVLSKGRGARRATILVVRRGLLRHPLLRRPGPPTAIEGLRAAGSAIFGGLGLPSCSPGFVPGASTGSLAGAAWLIRCKGWALGLALGTTRRHAPARAFSNRQWRSSRTGLAHAGREECQRRCAPAPYEIAPEDLSCGAGRRLGHHKPNQT